MKPDARCCGSPRVVERSTVAVILSRRASGLARIPLRAKVKYFTDHMVKSLR